MSESTLEVVSSDEHIELDAQIKSMIDNGFGIRQIIRKLGVTLSDIERAAAPAPAPAPAASVSVSQTLVPTVETIEQNPVTKRRLPVPEMIKQGLTLDEIIAASGARRNTILSAARFFGKSFNGTSLDTSISSLKEQGVNHSLIPHILGIEPSTVEAHGKDEPAPKDAQSESKVELLQSQFASTLQSQFKKESDIRAMLKNGASSKRVMELFGISSEELASIRARSSAPAVLSINNQREQAVADSEPSALRVNQGGSDPMKITTTAAAFTDPVRKENTGPDSTVIDAVKEQVVALAKNNYTVKEISEEVGISEFSVSTIAHDKNVFIPYSDKLRTDLNTVAKLSVNDGLSLTEIATAMKLSKSNLSKTLAHVIELNGRGSDIFKKLLDDESKPATPSMPAVSEKEPVVIKPAHPKTAKPLTYSGVIRVGDYIKVRPESEVKLREGVRWLSGRTVLAESLLDGVVMVSIIHRAKKSYEILRLSEVFKAPQSNVLAIGLHVFFTDNGKSYKGTVKTPPMDLPGESELHYGISISDGEDRVKGASELSLLPSETEK